MKRAAKFLALLLVFLFICVIFCGCEMPRPTIVFKGDFGTQVKLKCGDFTDSYRLKKDDGGITFQSSAEGLDFCLKDGVLTAALQDTKITVPDKISKNVPVKILAEILNESAGKEVTEDYNGVLSLHGTAAFGEWCITVDENGLPQKCAVPQRKLSAVFG